MTPEQAAATIERQAAELAAMAERAVAAEMAAEKLRDGLIEATGRMSVWNKDILAGLMPLEDSYSVIKAERLVYDTGQLDFTAARELMRKAKERDTLRRQLQESEALVERMRKALEAASNRIESIMETHKDLHLADDFRYYKEALALTPASALAEYRGEVLREAAKWIREGAKNYDRMHQSREQEAEFEIADRLEEEAMKEQPK